MEINLLPLGMALSSAYAALTFGTVQVSDAAPAGTPAQAREWYYEADANSISQSLNVWAAAGGVIQTPLGTARLQQLTVDVSNDELTVRGTATTGWFSVPVDAETTASVQSGNVQVHVVGAHVNGMDVPDAARGQLEQQLQSQVAQSVGRYGVVVRSVQLADGKLEITWVGP
jgi:hypothetical protein